MSYENVEQAQARIDELTASMTQSQADLAKVRTDLESARNDEAKYRVGRNEALRKGHALSKVVKAHNIEFDVATADLASLAIEDGAVKGEFDYSPPGTSGNSGSNRQAPGTSQPGSNAMTREDISNMSAEDINANWEEVSKVLKAGRTVLAA